MDKFKVAIWVIVIASMALKPFLKRRKERLEAQRLEAQKKGAAARPAPEPEEESSEEGGMTLPYEDLVEEVFGSYMARRREEARPRPAAPRPAARVVAPEPAAPKEVREEKVAAPAVPEAPASAPAEAPQTGRGSPFAEGHPRRPSLDERLFGRRRLSSSAKLILAAEILRPPRLPGDRGRSFHR
jgi:hypothetical protein